MKNIIIFLTCLCCSGSQAQNFKQHIQFLASDSLQGRAPGTTSEVKAAGYIASKFGAAKCKIVFQKFSFENDSATNVFGFLSSGKDSTVIISAHYDHLGLGSKKSKEIIRKGIHYGADDNASGVALMIELAKWVAAQEKRKYNFVFAAYSAHEAGLFGSGYFAKSAICDSLKIKAVINFDMVGRLDVISETLRVSGVDTASLFKDFFFYNQDSLLHFRFDNANIPNSDLKPFFEKGIPVLNLTTGIHDDYHRISDTENKINYNGMSKIYELLIRLHLQLF